MQMKKEFLLFLSLLFLTGCASSKLSRTVWHNVTMTQEKGVMSNVGTSLVFTTDSTVVVYKGVSIDSTVVISPYIFACGGYQCQKKDGREIGVEISATKIDKTPLLYSGKYNKKKGVMILNTPDSQLKETYIWNPDAKLDSIKQK